MAQHDIQTISILYLSRYNLSCPFVVVPEIYVWLCIQVFLYWQKEWWLSFRLEWMTSNVVAYSDNNCCLSFSRVTKYLCGVTKMFKVSLKISSNISSLNYLLSWYPWWRKVFQRNSGDVSSETTNLLELFFLILFLRKKQCFLQSFRVWLGAFPLLCGTIKSHINKMHNQCHKMFILVH